MVEIKFEKIDDYSYSSLVRLIKKHRKTRKHFDVFIRRSLQDDLKIGETPIGYAVVDGKYFIAIRDSWWKFWRKALITIIKKENITVDERNKKILIDNQKYKEVRMGE